MALHKKFCKEPGSPIINVPALHLRYVFTASFQDGQLTFFTFDPLKGKGAQVLQTKDELSQLYNWSLSPDGTTLVMAKGKWGEKNLAFISCASLADRING